MDNRIKSFVPRKVLFQTDTFCIAHGDGPIEEDVMGICYELNGVPAMPYNAAGQPMWLAMPKEFTAPMLMMLKTIPDERLVNIAEINRLLSTRADFFRALEFQIKRGLNATSNIPRNPHGLN